MLCCGWVNSIESNWIGLDWRGIWEIPWTRTGPHTHTHADNDSIPLTHKESERAFRSTHLILTVFRFQFFYNFFFLLVFVSDFFQWMDEWINEWMLRVHKVLPARTHTHSLAITIKFAELRIKNAISTPLTSIFVFGMYAHLCEIFLPVKKLHLYWIIWISFIFLLSPLSFRRSIIKFRLKSRFYL